MKKKDTEIKESKKNKDTVLDYNSNNSFSSRYTKLVLSLNTWIKN